MQYLHIEKYAILLAEIKEDLNKYKKKSHVHGLSDLILLNDNNLQVDL